MDGPAREKKVSLFSTTFLLPAGQWIIAAGAVMVAAGLTINARIAAKKAKEDSSSSSQRITRI